MGNYISALAQQAGTAAVGGAVAQGMGLIWGGAQDRRQLKQQRRLNELQIEGNKRMVDIQKNADLEMWKNTSYGAQKEQMEKAGINPALMYGMSGGGGITTGGSAPQVSGGQATAERTADSNGMGMQLGQMELMRAQIRMMNAQADKAEAEAVKTAGVDTELAGTQKENNILQGVILQYTGKEAKAQYEEVKQPNRDKEARAITDELTARSGIAQNINELFIEGKLMDKSNAEIEMLLVKNAKTREEIQMIHKQMDLVEQNIKGAKLSNIILELESKLQTQTGIDKTSAGWLKILGRLFVELTDK